MEQKGYIEQKYGLTAGERSELMPLTREEKREYDRNYYLAHRERIQELQKKWRREHPEKQREYHKRWRKAHLEKQHEYAREHYRKWKKEHSEQWQENMNRSTFKRWTTERETEIRLKSWKIRVYVFLRKKYLPKDEIHSSNFRFIDNPRHKQRFVELLKRNS